MSIKAVAIPLLSAGAAILAFNLLAGRRQGATRRGGAAAPGKRESLRRAASQRRAAKASALGAHLPGEVTLPTAFWDTAEVDQVDSSRHLTLGDEHEDTSETPDPGMPWARRNLHSFEVMSDDYVDDPAEIAADSMSMISEASRAAASNPAERDEEADDDRV
jgi:hypothetical protein